MNLPSAPTRIAVGIQSPGEGDTRLYDRLHGLCCLPSVSWLWSSISSEYRPTWTGSTPSTLTASTSA